MIRFYRPFWPTLFDDIDLLSQPVVLSKGSSLSVKANEDNEQAVYELKLPAGFDQKSIEATVEGDVLRVVIPKQKPTVPEEPDNKVKIKGV
jgi:HSP20 family molecular chaperone IbpA